MSVQSTNGTGVSTQVSWLALVTAKYKAIQPSIERRSFERSLEKIIRTANAHNSGGLSPGSVQFKLLREKADELCANFAQRWRVPHELLEAQIPAITKLKFLADPLPKANSALLVVLGILATTAIFFLLGVFAALVSAGYHVAGGR